MPVTESKLNVLTTYKGKDLNKRITLNKDTNDENSHVKRNNRSIRHEIQGTAAGNLQDKLRLIRSIYGGTVISALSIFLLIVLLSILATKRISKNNKNSGNSKNKHDTDLNKWNSYRLPSFINPIHYNILMHPNITNSNFSGKVNLYFKVTRKANFIVLHMVNLDWKEMHLKHDDTNTDIGIEKVGYNSDKGQLLLKVKRCFRRMQLYNLTIVFSGYLNNAYNGFSMTFYRNSDGQQRYIEYTNFKPNYARKAFPCFDEPAMKATFQIAIVYKRERHVFSNTRLQSYKRFDDHLNIMIFNKTEKISTYHVAFLISDFPQKGAEIFGNKEVRIITPYEKHIYDSKNITSELSSDLSTYLDFDYPLPKLDLVAIPNLYVSGVGYWGFIFIPTRCLNFVSNEIGINEEQYISLVIAHEVVHQWIGNIVTMQWWDDWWFQEGLTIYIKYLELNRIRTKWNMMKLIITDIKQPALHFDSLGSSNPIYSKINEINDTMNIFDDVNHLKTACLIRMLGTAVGEEKLLNSIRQYIKRYKFATAKSGDFWNILTEVIGNLNISKVMDTWMHQTGFPIIYANFTSSINSTLDLRQERFMLLKPHENIPNSASSLPNYTWFIPFQFVSNLNASNSIYWLNTTRRHYNLGNNFIWIKLNYKSSGFYRVMYNKNLWDSLRDQIRQNHDKFLPEDRSDLLDDVFTFAKNDILKVGFALDFSVYLEKEREFLPWKTALYHFHYMKLMLFNTIFYEKLQTHVQELMKQTVTELSANLNNLLQGELTDLDDTTSKLRELILTSAVKFNDKTAIDKALLIFEQWNKRGYFNDPNVALYTFTGTIIRGNRAMLATCWRKYKETISKQNEENNYFKRKSLIEGMAQIRNLKGLQRFLNYTLDGSIPSREEVSHLFSALSKNEYGNKEAWKFLKRNLPYFVGIYSNTATPSYLMSEIIQYLNTELEYEEVRTYIFRTMPKIQSKKIFFALDNLRANIFWKRNIQNATGDWLSKHEKPIPTTKSLKI